ncbi:alpha/beta-hydrolase [Choiromyces venosus 120613-1]|uniref:Alpha/beta-hydrolase n=1 Tax=Choiromyces venosus 120613-1 TaxID=1336337 RepID=A0A3N4KC80_9PEZI|nr:alpha/beta-hydrolase [Choiromyces venosus 120613-1]
MEYCHRLSWSPSDAPPVELPEGVQREFLTSPGGVLELLTSHVFSEGGEVEEKPPLLFIHGGFESAFDFTNYLQFFSSHGYSCYAVSLRGHGASYKLGYLSMFWTCKSLELSHGGSQYSFALDVVLAIAHIRSKHSKDVIIMGHSSGGGLSQYILDRNMEKLGGLVTLAAVPGFGSMGVYVNWVKLDPWFPIRIYFKHFGHPRSPLSSTSLVHNALFSRAFPVESVREVERTMPEYESMRWTVGMMTRFVSAERVVRNILPTLKGGRRVLVVGGGEDKLMSRGIMERLAAWYRIAWESIRGEGEEGVEEDSAEVVRFGVVEGSGHHVMKDTMWNVGAEMVLEWLEGR